jgi:hypothetical protein
MPPALNNKKSMRKSADFHRFLSKHVTSRTPCNGGIIATVEKARSSVESSYIENIKLERKEEKKLKEIIIKEKTIK